MYSSSLPLFLQFLVVFADEISTDASLEVGDDLCKTNVAHVFQHSENSRTEEDLRMAETELVRVKL